MRDMENIGRVWKPGQRQGPGQRGAGTYLVLAALPEGKPDGAFLTA